MKNLLMTAALIAGITPAIAGDVTVKVPDNFSVTMQNAGVAFERCTGAIAIKGDTSTCTMIANLLRELAALPTTPVPDPKPSPTPSPTGTINPAEADKK